MLHVRAIFILSAIFATFSSHAFCAGDADVAFARERNAQAKLAALEADRQKLYAEISATTEREQGGLERSRKISGLLARYENLHSEFPENLAVEILFAKFLRDAGEDARAKTLLEDAEKRAPEIASVRQQLGAIFAEEGDFGNALPRLRKAVELEPGTCAYQFQLGEFLATFRAGLLAGNFFADAAELDAALQNAFRACVAVEPANINFRLRYALSFYDVEKPNWRAALFAWETFARLVAEKSAENPAGAEQSAEFAKIHLARVHAELGEFASAETLLAESESSRFSRAREEIRKIIFQKKQILPRAFTNKNGNS